MLKMMVGGFRPVIVFNRRRLISLGPATGWLVLLLAALAWRWPNLNAFGLNNDEGAYMMWARLVAEGFPLYSQTQSVSAPLFIEFLAVVFRWFGFGFVTGRLAILVCFALLALALARLSFRIAGWPGAYLSLGFLAVLPPFFQFSRQVMAEIPATLLAVAAVACAERFWAQKSSRWLAVSGALLAISLLTKTLYPLAVLPIGWFIWRGSDTWPRRFKNGLWFALPLLLVAGLVISFYPWAAYVDQTIRFRGDLRAVSPWDWRTNLSPILAYSGDLWGAWLLAGAGLVIGFKQTRVQAWALWLAGNFALVMWHSPLFPHHLITLLPPVILLAIEFVAVAINLWRGKSGWGYVVPVLLGVALVAPVFNLPASVRANQALLAITTGGREAEAARVLQSVTRPADFVITDSQLFALLADRRTPPPLGDVALVAIKAGRQTPARLTQLTTDYNVQAVAPWALRLVWLPDYLAWAKANFWVEKVWDNDHKLYFGRKLPPDFAIPHEQTVLLGQALALRGYHVDTDTIRAGDDLPVTLYWQATQSAGQDYTVFVQLLAADGLLAAQYDSPPLAGYLPTSAWPAGEIIADRVTVALPPDLSPGRYTLITGMYLPQTSARLPLANGSGDFISLTTVTVQP